MAPDTAVQMQVRVRLSAIDAPERGQDFSQRSREALADLVYSKEVSIETHGKDRYGRVIGDVFVGGRLVNEVLVRQGWAWNFVKYSRSPRLAELERQARAERRGLWAGKNPVPPWEYRAEQAKKRKAKRQSGKLGILRRISRGKSVVSHAVDDLARSNPASWNRCSSPDSLGIRHRRGRVARVVSVGTFDIIGAHIP